MTAAGWVWMAVAAILAVLAWAGGAARSRLLERCAKPAVLLALLAAALTAHPSHAGVHGWLLLALGFGLVGDVSLSSAAAGQPAEAKVDRSQPAAVTVIPPEAEFEPDGPDNAIQA